ncbi:MAG: hypothetical protein GX593_05670 [Actinomycetales bacterium]|nr:hypothetical protein [Actinomycetales bacterium]
MSRIRADELELPVSLWVSQAGRGFAVQTLQAESMPGTWWGHFWGKRAPSGLILRNDHLGPTNPLDSRFILARLLTPESADGRPWSAQAHLYAIEPHWDARQLAREQSRRGLRTLAFYDVALYASEGAAHRAQARYDAITEESP